MGPLGRHVPRYQRVCRTMWFPGRCGAKVRGHAFVQGCLWRGSVNNALQPTPEDGAAERGRYTYRMDDRTLRRINHSEYHSTDRWPCETARARNVSAERLACVHLTRSSS